jgi:hypothetical protein
MSQHVLKMWPEFFMKLKAGEITAQLRRDDRNYQKDDTLFFREYDPKRDQYTGHTCFVFVTDVLRDFEGLVPGYCVISTKMSPDSCRYNVALTSKTSKQIEEEDKTNEARIVHRG